MAISLETRLLQMAKIVSLLVSFGHLLKSFGWSEWLVGFTCAVCAGCLLDWPILIVIAGLIFQAHETLRSCSNAHMNAALSRFSGF